MSREEDLIAETPVETLLKAKNLKNVLRAMFEDAAIITTKVRKGSSTSSNIYVPKEHFDKTATVIIWDNK